MAHRRGGGDGEGAGDARVRGRGDHRGGEERADERGVRVGLLRGRRERRVSAQRAEEGQRPRPGLRQRQAMRLIILRPGRRRHRLERSVATDSRGPPSTRRAGGGWFGALMIVGKAAKVRILMIRRLKSVINYFSHFLPLENGPICPYLITSSTLSFPLILPHEQTRRLSPQASASPVVYGRVSYLLRISIAFLFGCVV